MATPGTKNVIADTIRKRWRAWFRVLHRDAGYLAVGLTFVYAISGLALNHISDFNANFKTETTTRQMKAPLPADDKAAEAAVLAEIAEPREPRDLFVDSRTIEVRYDKRTVVVDRATGTLSDEKEQARFFLRIANWLHANRGKAAWTYIADGYAVFLLFLAISGPLLLKGRNGLIGRGGILILLGALVPFLYVHFSQGP